MSHPESLPVLFINHDLQHVTKHTNKNLEENKTQSSLTTLSHDHCAPSAARVQHQQERHRIQKEHFNREDNITYFHHVDTTPPPEITITGALRPALMDVPPSSRPYQTRHGIRTHTRLRVETYTW